MTIRGKITKKILEAAAGWVLRVYKPVVIVITGSAGKTSTKEAVSTVLERHWKIRKTERNLNTELGVPLTIIGAEIESYRVSFTTVTRGIAEALCLIVFRQKTFPQALVLELGADRPGDIKSFMRWIKPTISVVTSVGEIPVHVEYYSGPQEVAQEKSWIVKKTRKDGYAILNRDDEVVYEMKEKTKANVITFGFAEEADFRIAEYGFRENGIGFKLFHKGTFVPIRLNNCFGKPAAYAAAAASAVGVAMGLNLVEIADALLGYQPPPGRMRLLGGVKGTRIIDDTYNASPSAMHAALETLDQISSKRKIAVLGDMREIGKYSYEAHETVGFFAAGICDYIFTVGDSAKIIQEGARKKGFDEKRMMHFNESVEAGSKLQEILESGDLVLVKGSRAMRMEKIVEEIMAEPERAKELLVH